LLTTYFDHNFLSWFFQPKGCGFYLPRFELSVKEGTTMLWKAANVQLRNVKAKNVGSYFSASQIEASEAMCKDRGFEKQKHNMFQCVNSMVALPGTSIS